jgi:hypothetical protein
MFPMSGYITTGGNTSGSTTTTTPVSTDDVAVLQHTIRTLSLWTAIRNLSEADRVKLVEQGGIPGGIGGNGGTMMDHNFTTVGQILPIIGSYYNGSVSAWDNSTNAPAILLLDTANFTPNTTEKMHFVNGSTTQPISVQASGGAEVAYYKSNTARTYVSNELVRQIPARGCAYIERYGTTSAGAPRLRVYIYP